MFDPDIQKKAISLIMGFIMEFSGVSPEPEPIKLTADNLNVSTVSVSCLKVSWDSEPDRDYYVSCTAHDDNYAYGDAYCGDDSILFDGVAAEDERHQKHYREHHPDGFPDQRLPDREFFAVAHDQRGDHADEAVDQRVHEDFVAELLVGS